MDGVVSEQVRTQRSEPGDEGRRSLAILAVSDDLTGAAALAGEFHAAGLDACVAGLPGPASAGERAESVTT